MKLYTCKANGISVTKPTLYTVQLGEGVGLFFLPVFADRHTEKQATLAGYVDGRGSHIIMVWCRYKAKL